MQRNRFAPKVSSVPKCKQCRKPLSSSFDSEVGMCGECFPMHGSPSCRTGFCVERVELAR